MNALKKAAAVMIAALLAIFAVSGCAPEEAEHTSAEPDAEHTEIRQDEEHEDIKPDEKYTKAPAIKIRSSEPDRENKYYISTEYGGYNRCLIIDKETGSCLPNCVGYAWGRAYEALGREPDLSRGNAWHWYGYNKDGGYYPYGSKPESCSIACWSNAEGTLGHVAFVENVTGDIVTISESRYGGVRWDTDSMLAEDMENYSGYILQGYIYVGKIFER